MPAHCPAVSAVSPAARAATGNNRNWRAQSKTACRYRDIRLQFMPGNGRPPRSLDIAADCRLHGCMAGTHARLFHAHIVRVTIVNNPATMFDRKRGAGACQHHARGEE
jgi:hypothetical protein